jgi:hypothetical protein
VREQAFEIERLKEELRLATHKRFGASPDFSPWLSASGLRISESCCEATTLLKTEGVPDGDRV